MTLCLELGTKLVICIFSFYNPPLNFNVILQRLKWCANSYSLNKKCLLIFPFCTYYFQYIFTSVFQTCLVVCTLLSTFISAFQSAKSQSYHFPQPSLNFSLKLNTTFSVLQHFPTKLIYFHLPQTISAYSVCHTSGPQSQTAI